MTTLLNSFNSSNTKVGIIGPIDSWIVDLSARPQMSDKCEEKTKVFYK